MRGAHRRTIRNLARMGLRRPMRGVLAVVCAALLVGSGCARFDDTQSQPFTTEPELTPGPSSTPPPPPPLPPKPFPKECPAPGVMQGCLESTSGLIMLPDSQSALVAERTTGAVKEVSVRAEPKVKTVLPVDGSGDGGLMDIVLSPTYAAGPADVRLRQHPDRQPGHPHRRRRHSQADPDRHPQGRDRQHGCADLHQPDHAVGADRRRGRPRAGGRRPFAGGQGPAHRAADDGGPGSDHHSAVRLGRGRRNVYRPVRRVAVHHRSHTDRRPPAANHQGFQGDDGVDVARPPGRGRMRGPRRHRAGESREHQAVRRRPPGPRHRRCHR